ncbi:TPA: hypothetical protein I8007_001988 [Legionella pneumophila]|nr:hypothetical protein [Legionella pneumophila]
MVVVSVVGFLDEGLLVFLAFLKSSYLSVSVVGFLDEGLLGNITATRAKACEFQWLDF